MYPPLLSVKECTQAFGNERVCVYSNSAGLEQYDPNGMEAKHLEKELGILWRDTRRRNRAEVVELAKFLNNDSHSKKESSNSRRDEFSVRKVRFRRRQVPHRRRLREQIRHVYLRVAPFDVSNESKIAARSIGYFADGERKTKRNQPPRARRRTSDQESVYLKTNARSWRE